MVICAGSRVVTAIIQSMGVVMGGSVRNNTLQEVALCPRPQISIGASEAASFVMHTQYVMYPTESRLDAHTIARAPP